MGTERFDPIDRSRDFYSYIVAINIQSRRRDCYSHNCSACLFCGSLSKKTNEGIDDYYHQYPRLNFNLLFCIYYAKSISLFK